MSGEQVKLLPAEVTQSIRQELIDTVRAAHLSRDSEDAVLRALSGPTRVLPEGKPSLCAALTFLSHASAAREESLKAVPAVVALEMLMAAGDIIDDIQDDEAALPGDRHAVGQLLEVVTLLLMLCHSAIGRLVDRNVPHSRVLRGLRTLDSLGVDALRGQILDIDLEARMDVSVEDALQVSGLKSASLTRCAAELGATLGTDNIAEIDLHARLGWHLGVLMQLTNDIAAVWPGGTDKSDLRLRKKTVPPVFALNMPHRFDRYAHIVQSFYDENDSSSVSEDDVRNALWRCGAIHYTWIVAAREKAQAQCIGRILSERATGDWPLGRLLS